MPSRPVPPQPVRAFPPAAGQAGFANQSPFAGGFPDVAVGGGFTNQFGTNLSVADLSLFLLNLQNDIEQTLPVLASFTSGFGIGNLPEQDASSCAILHRALLATRSHCACGKSRRRADANRFDQCLRISAWLDSGSLHEFGWYGP